MHAVASAAPKQACMHVGKAATTDNSWCVPTWQKPGMHVRLACVRVVHALTHMGGASTKQTPALEHDMWHTCIVPIGMNTRRRAAMQAWSGMVKWFG